MGMTSSGLYFMMVASALIGCLRYWTNQDPLNYLMAAGFLLLIANRMRQLEAAAGENQAVVSPTAAQDSGEVYLAKTVDENRWTT